MVVYRKQSETMFSIGPDQESIDKIQELGFNAFDTDNVRYIIPPDTDTGLWEVELGNVSKV